MRLCCLLHVTSQRRRISSSGTDLPPTCLHVGSEAGSKEVSDFGHAEGKLREGLLLGLGWRLCWAFLPAKSTLIRWQLHIITAHAAQGPKLSGERSAWPAASGLCDIGGRGVCTSSLRPLWSIETFGVLVKEPKTRLRICQFESLNHRATVMEFIGVLVQSSNIGYDSLSTRLSILSPKPLTLGWWAYRTVIAIITAPFPRQAL